MSFCYDQLKSQKSTEIPQNQLAHFLEKSNHKRISETGKRKSKTPRPAAGWDGGLAKVSIFFVNSVYLFQRLLELQ